MVRSSTPFETTKFNWCLTFTVNTIYAVTAYRKCKDFGTEAQNSFAKSDTPLQSSGRLSLATGRLAESLIRQVWYIVCPAAALICNCYARTHSGLLSAKLSSVLLRICMKITNTKFWKIQTRVTLVWNVLSYYFIAVIYWK